MKADGQFCLLLATVNRKKVHTWMDSCSSASLIPEKTVEREKGRVNGVRAWVRSAGRERKSFRVRRWSTVRVS